MLHAFYNSHKSTVNQNYVISKLQKIDELKQTKILHKLYTSLKTFTDCSVLEIED